MEKKSKGWDSRRIALLVICHESKVADYFSSKDTVTIAVHTCADAFSVLDSGAAIGLVVTDDELPDGDWRAVVDRVRRRGLRIEVLVRHKLGEAILGQGVSAPWKFDLATSA